MACSSCASWSARTDGLIALVLLLYRSSSPCWRCCWSFRRSRRDSRDDVAMRALRGGRASVRMRCEAVRVRLEANMPSSRALAESRLGKPAVSKRSASCLRTRERRDPACLLEMTASSRTQRTGHLQYVGTQIAAHGEEAGCYEGAAQTPNTLGLDQSRFGCES